MKNAFWPGRLVGEARISARRIASVLPRMMMIFIFLTGTLGELQASAMAFGKEPGVKGPLTGEVVKPTEFKGDLRHLPSVLTANADGEPIEIEKYAPGTQPKGASNTIAGWVDPVAQTDPGSGQMPGPASSFAGMSYQSAGNGWLSNPYMPPDPVGDVGPTYYVQMVNTSVAFFNKSNGNLVAAYPLSQFFQNAQAPCNSTNNGDPVVLYDRMAQRWIVSDFSVAGPFYECVAVSKWKDPFDPINGGWYYYAIKISDTYMNDYPKLAAWPDAYFVTFNMFTNTTPASWEGVQVWALDKAAMLNGQSFTPVYYWLGPDTPYASLLPAHALSTPPAGSPGYFASVQPPNQFLLWKFHPDFVTPANSSFTGPATLNVADFAIAASVPQKSSSILLDSLSYRPMMQLQYRTVGGVESLWFDHTVASGGVGSQRWYEVRNPNGSPVIAQQGTYQPDTNHRWMGSLAVDKDGNMAVGYSVSSSSAFPSIRYTGRLNGEMPGALLQGETTLADGAGSQTYSTRWGDYSAMSVDPDDDCTFWYTNEYYLNSGNNWQTRIGSFKFPSCGQPKGTLTGQLINSVTHAPIPGVKVRASSAAQTFTAQTDSGGNYSMSLMGGTYNLSAGPLPPGYPAAGTVNGVSVTAGSTTTQNISLTPVPNLSAKTAQVDDNVPEANGNTAPEPGEQKMKLYLTIQNTGAVTATSISAQLTSLTSGVTISSTHAAYPDLPIGASAVNLAPFVFSIGTNVSCGSDFAVRETVTTLQGSFNITFTLNAALPLPRANVFLNDVESGAAGWTTVGVNNTWAIIDSASHSPSHSWTDSPAANYADNTNSTLVSPTYNLTGKRHVQVSGWYKYALEAGYDFVYLEYSLDGGFNWNPTPLDTFNGTQNAWTKSTVDASVLDNQPNVKLRYRLMTDAGVTMDGIYIDDVSLSYVPFACTYGKPGTPIPVLPYNNSKKVSPVTFQWADSELGSKPAGYLLTIDGSNIITVTGTIISATVPLALGAHTYTIAAFNAWGKSAPSSAWNVEVIAYDNTRKPAAPILLAPANNAFIPPSQITFHWSDSGGGGTPAGYVLKIGETKMVTFTRPITDYVIDLAPGAYNWQVKAVNELGSSDWSTPWLINLFYRFFLPFVGK